MKLYFKLLCVCWCILLVSHTKAATVEFYKYSNFTGLIHEGVPTDTCRNFPDKKLIHVGSIKTDSCVLAYNYHNCRSSDWKEKYNNDTVTSIYFHYGSYHLCSENQSKPQLNIDITNSNVDYNFNLTIEKHYENICSCLNIAPDVQDLPKWTISSNGNNFMAYFEPDCTETQWKAQLFEISSTHSRNMHQYFKTDPETNTISKIQSLGPDTNSAYFINSCNAGAAESSSNNEFDNNDQIKSLADKVEQLQEQVDESKHIINDFQKGMESIIKQHKDDFSKLTEKIRILSKLTEGYKKKSVDNTPKICLIKCYRSRLPQKLDSVW